MMHALALYVAMVVASGGTVTVSWDVPDRATEVWASTNLVDWSLKAVVPTRVSVDFPRNEAAEFYKLRTVDTTSGAVSVWGGK